MPPQTPRRGEVITRQGKKYRFEGVDAATGQWKLRPLGAAEGQSDAEGFARTAAQGATFGFSDEIAGGLGWLGGKGYKASRDRERENLAQYREEHGKTAMLAEGLGGLATGLLAPGLLAAKAGGAGVRGAIGLARGGSAAARTARAAELAGGVGKGGTALSKMGQAAKLGAAEGGIYGVGSGGEQRGATLGESLKSRALSGAGGAAIGGLLGGGMAGGLAAGSKGLDFYQGLKAGRLGKGGTAQIGKDLDDAAAAALPDSGPGGLVETGGSRAVAADDAAAHGLAELERVKDPKAFTAKANEWLSKVDKKSPEYQKYLDSGQSEHYAATMQLAEDALKKEGTKGVVPGLLADRTKRHRATATLAARTTEGPEAGLLEVATTRPESVTRALDDVQPAFGPRAFEAPGSARTIERLTEEGRELAKTSYDAVYHLDDHVRRAIHHDKTYQNVIKRMTRAFGSGGEKIPGMAEAFTRARRAAVVAAEEAGNKVKANKLRRVNTSNLLGRFEKTKTGRLKYREPNMGALTRAGGPESLDILRRTLEEMKEGMMREGSEATNVKLGYTMKKFIAQLDDAIADVPGAGLFDDARAGYAGRKGIKEAYEDAPNIIKKSRESVKAYVDGLKKRGKDVKIEIGTNDAGATVMRSELDMFKQRVLDDFVDKMDVEDVAAPKEIARLKRDFNKLFGGKKPILDASGADVKRIAQNLDELAKQAKLGKELAEMKPMPASADLEGMVEATAFGYALAGQPGAAARTGLASTVYGPGRWENVGGAMARRLRQTEGEGLLNIAETVGRTEGDKVRQLARRHAVSGATPGLLGGQRQEAEFGDRYRGYTPRAARRRAWEEANETFGGGLLNNGGAPSLDGAPTPPAEPTLPAQPITPGQDASSVRTASNVIGGEPEKGEYELLLNDPGDYTENEIPRGVVNNNPMNLKDDGSPWQGWDKTSRDEDFIKFDNPEAGVRAGMLNHLTHFERGDNTVDKLLERASPREDNPDFETYADYVAEQMGVDRDEQIDLEDENIGNAFALAVVDFELGAGEDPWGGALIAGLRSAYRAHRAKIARRSTTLAAASRT